MKTKRFRIALLAGALAATASLPTLAQQITSTAQLKRACETSPGNVVSVTTPSKIFLGSRPPLATRVLTGCTLRLAPDVSLEFDRVGLAFDGPFAIEAAGKDRVVLVQSAISAPSVTLSLESTENGLIVDRSSLSARAGDIALRFGAQGFANLKEVLAGTTLVASGRIDVSGGDRFAFEAVDVSVRAGAGIAWRAAGPEATMGVSNSVLAAASGAIEVASAGDKAFVEWQKSRVEASAGISVTLPGRESAFATDESVVDAGAGTLAVTLEGELSKAVFATVQANASGDVSVSVSRNATKGEVFFEKGNAFAGGRVSFETGRDGTTEVKENALAAGTAIRVATGAGGKCLQEGNTLTAPLLDLCR